MDCLTTEERVKEFKQKKYKSDVSNVAIFEHYEMIMIFKIDLLCKELTRL